MLDPRIFRFGTLFMTFRELRGGTVVCLWLAELNDVRYTGCI